MKPVKPNVPQWIAVEYRKLWGLANELARLRGQVESLQAKLQQALQPGLFTPVIEEKTDGIPSQSDKPAGVQYPPHHDKPQGQTGLASASAERPADNPDRGGNPECPGTGRKPSGTGTKKG